MAPGIQAIGVVRAFEQLNLTDRSVEAGQIDPTQLSAVAPIELGWIQLRPFKSANDGISINGVKVDLTDTSDFSVTWGRPLDLAQNRYYTHIWCKAAGGTVTPLNWVLSYDVGGSEMEFFRLSVANPGRFTYGPVFVPAGAALIVKTATNGGAGDAADVRAFGYQQHVGVPMPLFPRGDHLEYP